MRIQEKLKKIKSRKLFFAIVMNLVVLFILILLFYARYNCELDITMQALLYGTAAEEGYWSHLIFSNIFLGKILSILMSLFPVVAWYTIFHYVMAFISMVIITEIVVIYNNNLSGRIVSTIISIFIGYECYIMPMYMKTAVLLTTASFMIWGYILFHKKEWDRYSRKKIVYSCLPQAVLAGILNVVGSWISFRVYVMTVVIVLIGFGVRILRNRRLGPCQILAGCSFAGALLISIICRQVDIHIYAGDPGWNEAGTYRDAVEQLYAFGFPEYEDVEFVLKTNDYLDVDEITYNMMRSGIYSDSRVNFELLQLIADQRVSFNTWKFFLFFRVVPIRAFKTGMFYLWVILAIVSGYCGGRKVIPRVLVSLGMIFFPYFILYFRYGYESQFLGMIAYLPAIIFLLMGMKDIALAEERYACVYLGLLGLVLYYIFSGDMVRDIQETSELKDIVAINKEKAPHAHLIDFNYYIQGFSIYQVYPGNVDNEKVFLANGIYHLVPGVRRTHQLADEFSKNWNGVEIYGRNEEVIQIAAENVGYYVDLNMYNLEYGDSFHRLVHHVYN